MKLYVLMAMLATIGLFGIAGFLCYKGISGWGWFLFAAIIVGGFSYSEKSEKKEVDGKTKKEINL